MSVLTILGTLQGEINDVLEKTYSTSGPGKITCKVNNDIVKLVNNSGLLKAAQNISDEELTQLASVLEKNIKNMNAALSSLTCKAKGGAKKRSKKGGAEDSKFAIFLDGTTSGGSKGGMPRRTTRGRTSRRTTAQDEEEEEDEEGQLESEEDQSVSTSATGTSSRGRRGTRAAPQSAPANIGADAGVNFETPMSPQYSPTTPPGRTARQAGPSPLGQSRPATVIADTMPSNVGTAQDMMANLDGYEILSIFYLALINGVLVGTGAYAAAIDNVAGTAGEMIGLPDLNAVCGVAQREVRAQGARYLRTGIECLEAQQRWEQLLISLGVIVFVVLAIISSRGTRRIDPTARSRGTMAMTYEMSMAGVTTLADYMRGVPKGSAPPPPDSRSLASRVLSNPINALANLASNMWAAAAGLFRSSEPQTAAAPSGRVLALEDMPSPPPPSRQASASASSGNRIGFPGDSVQPQDQAAIRAARLARLGGIPDTRPRSESVSSDITDDGSDTEGGRKKRRTRRRKSKAKKAKKARKTRRKAPKKTRKAKKAKKGKKANKKARKTKRR